jgi:hypothetical protein
MGSAGGSILGRGFVLAVVVLAVAVSAPSPGEASSSRFCANATKRSFVVQQACRAIPRLRDSRTSDYQATKLLRIWADTWIDIAATGDTLGSDDFLVSNIDDRYRRFLKNEGGVFCFHAATTLMAVYHEFGFDAWVLSIGDANTYTHAVTLVRVGKKLVVQDAYLNYSFVDRSGHPLDVREAMRRLRRGRTDLIRHEEPRVVAPRDVLYPPAVYEAWNRLGEHFPAGPARNLRSCQWTSRGFVACAVPGIKFARLGFFMADLAVISPAGYAAMPGATWREKAALWLLKPFALTSLDANVFLSQPSGAPLYALLFTLASTAGVSTNASQVAAK